MIEEGLRFQVGDRVSIMDPDCPVFNHETATVVSIKSGVYSLNHDTHFQEFVKINPCDDCVVCCYDDEGIECVRSRNKLKKIGNWTVEELLTNENPFIHQAGIRLFKEQNNVES